MTVWSVMGYPFTGMYYFSIHIECWKYFRMNFIPLLLVASGIYGSVTVVYITLWLSTGGFISVIGPTTFQIATFLVNFINNFFLLPTPLNHTFDFVVSQELSLNYNGLPKGVLGNRLTGYYGETFIGRCYRKFKTFVGPEKWLLREVIFLFLNMIPIIGPILVILLKSSRVGFSKQLRYCYLKGYNHAEIEFLWRKKRSYYFTFGFISLLLEEIPFLNIYFYFTNVTGAALWAVDIEKQYLKRIELLEEVLEEKLTEEKTITEGVKNEKKIE